MAKGVKVSGSRLKFKLRVFGLGPNRRVVGLVFNRHRFMSLQNTVLALGPAHEAPKLPKTFQSPQISRKKKPKP